LKTQRKYSNSTTSHFIANIIRTQQQQGAHRNANWGNQHTSCAHCGLRRGVDFGGPIIVVLPPHYVPVTPSENNASIVDKGAVRAPSTALSRVEVRTDSGTLGVDVSLILANLS
jgi:hypothetical protein